MTADDIAGRGPVVRITDPAREKVLRVRAGQPNPERLALRIEVIGISGGEYESTASFPLLEDAGPDDVVQHHNGLAIVIPADSVEKLRGATIDLEGNLILGSLLIINPNSPSPAVAAASQPPPDLKATSPSGSCRSSPSRSTRASPPTAATPSSSPSRTRPPTCA